jgi:hypothetical protein
MLLAGSAEMRYWQQFQFAVVAAPQEFGLALTSNIPLIFRLGKRL